MFYFQLVCPGPRFSKSWELKRPKAVCGVNGISMWGMGPFPAQLFRSVILGIQAVPWRFGLLRRCLACSNVEEIDLRMSIVRFRSHGWYMCNDVRLGNSMSLSRGQKSRDWSSVV